MNTQQIVFANRGAQKRYQCAQHAAYKLLLARWKEVISPLVWQLADAKDDHALGVADAPQFALLVLDGFSRSDRLPDMVRAIALYVAASLEASQGLQRHRSQRPQHLPGRACEFWRVGRQCFENSRRVHGGSFVLFLRANQQMTRVDTPALLEKVADGHWPLVVHDRLRHVDHAQAALRNDGLQGE